ncbi:MAG: hypothetical protein JRI23_11150, partial [Deltaproteobacteria bacterium]|nr:hypothetical protein [Deltaproteobacteria bacterium]MBW2532239.1 hypothetical protein [Deltaproteobacteria bacterium]
MRRLALWGSGGVMYLIIAATSCGDPFGTGDETTPTGAGSITTTTPAGTGVGNTTTGNGGN